MPFISTSYDYDALIDEYGMQSFNLQYYRYDYFWFIFGLCFKLFSDMNAFFLYLLRFTIQILDCCYKTGTVCSAFLANTGTSNATVTFNGNSYHLPGWFVSILPDCKNVVLNTAKVCRCLFFYYLSKVVSSINLSCFFVRHISEPGLLEQ
ncbi:beta-galactosidase [Trifolium repens]|nr:beta-galactosidase [Trifolium repens]